MGIGDEIMATGDARRLRMKDPRPVAIVGRTGIWRHHELWAGLPSIALPPPGARIEPPKDFQRLRSGGGCRPYIDVETPERWRYRAGYRPTPGELVLGPVELALGAETARAFGRFVVVEPNVKAKASPNKRWPWRHWEALAQALRAQGLPLLQLGPPGLPLLPGALCRPTPRLRDALGILAHAALVVTHEGALHHAAAALNVPAVVVRGAFIAPQVTGYAGQVDLWRPHEPASAAWPEGESCGARRACARCAAAMASISAAAVARAVDEVMNGAEKSQSAA